MKQPLETFISKWVEIAHMHRPPLQELEDAKLTATQHLCGRYEFPKKSQQNVFFPSHNLCNVTMQFDMVTFVVIG
jgi:hypothetical protein